MSRTASQTRPVPKSILDSGPDKPKETFRDLVEQIVVAVILAILIRGYDAEAFVIPTGSMAPTLMGRHKEISCPECGLVYAINVSDESEVALNERRARLSRQLDEAKQAPQRLLQAREMKATAQKLGDRARAASADELIDQLQRDAENGDRLAAELNQLHEVGLCVNCRTQAVVDDAPSFKGDRILVMKFPFEMPFLPGAAGPARWDVVVFHYPEKPETNYIKRLVGLPNEELRINHGDIESRPIDSNAPFQVQRKPMIHQRAMAMLVHDDAHRPRSLAGKPAWTRWKPSGPWKEAEPGTFAIAPDDKDGNAWSELRYRHVLPDPEQWDALKEGKIPARAPRPTLITDFYSYNTNSSFGQDFDADAWLQSNWVGDLTISGRFDLEAASPGGMLKLELIEAGLSNRCEVDLISGMASLYHDEKKLGESPTVLRGIGAHDVEFANVDDRLSLLIDGEATFLDGLPYDDAPLAAYAPTERDLDPVGIAIKATRATVSGLVLKRDIYYTQAPRDPDFAINSYLDDFDRGNRGPYAKVIAMFDFLADPAKFAALKDSSSRRSYVIHSDHFMMMGDNSPRSSDSRAWNSNDSAWRKEGQDRASWEVPRSLLIGKAFFVYWPHGKPIWPDLPLFRFSNIRVPFRPYVERMKLIR